MRKLFLAGAASLAALSIPAAVSAQDAEAQVTADASAEVELDAQQRAIYDEWPADRRAAFHAWNNEYKQYYWTLTPTQQEGYWLLNDEQRAQIAAMTPDQRTAAWQSIEQQLNRAQATAPNSANASQTAQAATSAAATASTSAPRSVAGEVAQTVPAPPREYPICKGDNDDSCINPWAAGKRGPGVNRPLDHWPGRPASEIDDDRGG